MASGTTNDGDDLAPGLVLDPLDVLEPDDALDLSLRRAVWKNGHPERLLATGHTNRYLAERYSKCHHSTENGAAAAPHESALNRAG